MLGTANSAPLHSYIPDFLTGGGGGGRICERHEIVLDFENLNDKNYRGISWGMDAPGRGFGFRYDYKFWGELKPKKVATGRTQDKESMGTLVREDTHC